MNPREFREFCRLQIKYAQERYENQEITLQEFNVIRAKHLDEILESIENEESIGD